MSAGCKIPAMAEQPRVIVAKFPGTCGLCEHKFAKGHRIVESFKGWVHASCAGLTRSRQQILSGETYRGRQQSTWRRGKGPGSGRDPRY